MRRSYSFIATTVRFTGEQPCETPAPLLPGVDLAEAAPHPQPSGPTAESRSPYARLKALARKWFSQ
jgi:hypothetical protein